MVLNVNKRICQAAVVMLLFLNPLQVKAQAIVAGDIVVDAYYGFPNLTGVFLEAIVDQDPVLGPVDYTSRHRGPFGAKFEYAITNGFSIGAEIYYSSNYLNFYDRGVSNYYYRMSQTNLRIMPKFVFHYTHDSGNGALDMYGNFGIGYREIIASLETNDPFFEEEDLVNEGIPVSFRLVPFGLRYYFTESLGITTEIGLGGALISLGVSGKL